MNEDFRTIIIEQSNKNKGPKFWEGSIIEYLKKVQDNPNITNFAPGRIYDMIMKYGTEKVDESIKTKGYEDLVSYNFFHKRGIFGAYEGIHDLMKFLKAAARRTETGKRILIMVGPVSSGKSTIASFIKRGLELDDTPKYAIKGCPIHEEPLHVIPLKDRPYWEDKLNVKIEGNLCPVCLQMIESKYANEEGIIEWDKIPVESVKFSEQKRVGIGTFQPSDPKCVSHDTLLLSNYGLLTFSELQEIFQADDNKSVNIDIIVDGINGPEKTSHFFNNGIQKTLKINTSMGYEETVTEIHPLYVLKNGKTKWCKAKDIKESDYIGLKIGQMIFGDNNYLPEFKYDGPNPRGNNVNMMFPSTLTPELSKVLGYLVSEGSHDKYSMWFSNLDEELKNDFNRYFYSVFNIEPKTYGRACSVSSVKLCSFLDDVCGIKHGAINKNIPLIIRRSSKDNILAFLEGMFWGDGTISTRKSMNSNYFKYGSKSELLINQLKTMLLNLGVVSSKGTYTSKDGFVNHDSAVRGDEVLKLLKLIPSLYNKKTDEGEFFDKRNSSNWDVIPNVEPLFSDILSDIKEKIGPIYKINEISKYERYKSYSDWGRTPRRSTVLSFLKEVNKLGVHSNSVNELTSIAENNTIWLKVNSINDGGYQQVYDITVPKTHSFCANGFINHNSQDVTELIGSVKMAKLDRYGENDPRAYDFKGELQVSNGGLIEYIEILKADIKFHYVLITAAQEQLIKAPGFPQMYIDTLILSHSIVGETPIPYKENEIIKFDTIENLTIKNNTNIEVIAINLITKNPVWTKVKSFIKHPFTGNLIKTIQKNGFVETTYNHSIYSKDYKCFYPEDMKDILTVNTIPFTNNIEHFNLNISNDMIIEKNSYVRMKCIEGNQGNGNLKKHQLKYSYHVKHAKNILKTLAWYITEGHIINETENRRGNGISIAQKNISVLEDLKKASSKLTTTKLYLNDRTNTEDGTNRLEFNSTIWAKIMELNCGRYSKNKKIPNFVFNLPIELKEYFINELVKGDGSFNNRLIKVNTILLKNHFSYKTISKMLASQFCFLLSQLGINYNLNINKTKNGEDSFSIYTINKSIDKRTNKIENTYVENTNVYDIECIDNHSFVAGIGNVVCHNTNETEFDTFRSDKKNEALHDRMYKVTMPWNLKVDDEIKIYEKMIKESDFRNIHIAPHTLKLAAEFAVLSRLTQSTKVSSLIQKMKLYNGEIIDEFKKSDIDVKSLKEEGRNNGEGMTGISPRFIINALDVALGKKEEKNCINPIDMIRALRDNFNHHIGISDEDKEKYIGNLMGNKDSVSSEYKKVALKEVNMAFLYAYEEQAEELFSRYMKNIGAYCKKDKIKDIITGEYSDPDEKIMRSIEDYIGVPQQSKKEFRNGVFVYEADFLRQNKPFGFKDYDPIREAIEKKLMADLKNVVSLTLADSSNTNPKQTKRREKALETLLEKGYCSECAQTLLVFIGEILRQA